MFNNIVCSFFSSPQSLKDVIVNLQMKLNNETHVYHVRRSDLFEDLLRETRKRSYRPSKHVKTDFVGEPGEDTGGLTRELWCLFGKYLQQSLCEDKENCLVFRHDATKLQVCALHVVCSSIKGNVAVYKVLNIETRYNTTDGQYAYVRSRCVRPYTHAYAASGTGD